MPATYLEDLEVRTMMAEQQQNEIHYQLSMKMAADLLKKGVITEDDYHNFDTKMQQKYRPKFGDLFWEKRPEIA